MSMKPTAPLIEPARVTTAAAPDPKKGSNGTVGISKCLQSNIPASYLYQVLLQSREVVRKGVGARAAEGCKLRLVEGAFESLLEGPLVLGVALVEAGETMCWPVRYTSFVEVAAGAAGRQEKNWMEASLMLGLAGSDYWLFVEEEGLRVECVNPESKLRCVVFCGDHVRHGVNICGHVGVAGGMMGWSELEEAWTLGASSVGCNGALVLGGWLFRLRVGSGDTWEEIWVPPHYNLLGWTGLLAVVNYNGGRDISWVSGAKRKRLDSEAERKWQGFVTKKNKVEGRVLRRVDEEEAILRGDILPASPLVDAGLYSGGLYAVISEQCLRGELFGGPTGAARGNLVTFGMSGRSVVLGVHRELHGVDSLLEVETGFTRGRVFGDLKSKYQKGSLVVCSGAPNVVGLGGVGMFGQEEISGFCARACGLRFLFEDVKLPGL